MAERPTSARRVSTRSTAAARRGAVGGPHHDDEFGRPARAGPGAVRGGSRSPGRRTRSGRPGGRRCPARRRALVPRGGSRPHPGTGWRRRRSRTRRSRRPRRLPERREGQDSRGSSSPRPWEYESPMTATVGPVPTTSARRGSHAALIDRHRSAKSLRRVAGAWTRQRRRPDPRRRPEKHPCYNGRSDSRLRLMGASPQTSPMKQGESYVGGRTRTGPHEPFGPRGQEQGPGRACHRRRAARRVVARRASPTAE